MNKKILLVVVLLLKCNQSAEPREPDYWKEFSLLDWKELKPFLCFATATAGLVLLCGKAHDYYQKNQPADRRLIEVERLLKHDNFQSVKDQQRLKKEKAMLEEQLKREGEAKKNEEEMNRAFNNEIEKSLKTKLHPNRNQENEEDDFFFRKKQLLNQNYSQGIISPIFNHYHKYNLNLINKVSNRPSENIKRYLGLFDSEEKEQKLKESIPFDIFACLP